MPSEQSGVDTARESDGWELVDIGPTFTFGRSDCPRCGRDRRTFDPDRLYCHFCLNMLAIEMAEERQTSQEGDSA